MTTIILVIILVTLLEVNIYTLLVGLGTTFLGLGFALSTTIQGLLESLQMIFFGIREGEKSEGDRVGREEWRF